MSEIDDFKIMLGDTIMLYQVVENDIRIIRAQMRKGDPEQNLEEDKEKYNFIGNIEGRELFLNHSDIVVCDGFVGNVVLKVTEGTVSSEN